MRVVQVANFYGPRSGGLRTAVDRLGAEYCAAGHEVFLVVPGQRAERSQLRPGVVRITLPARLIPLTGGYRAVMPGPVKALLEALRPDALEVSDRLTLRSLGRWGREHGATTVMISHERLDRLVGQILPRRAAQKFADLANARTAADYDTVVCTTGFAREEFDRIGATNTVTVPLGVDLQTFHPRRHSYLVRRRWAAPTQMLLVHCGRLSVEKRVDRSIDALGALCHAGVDARLVVVGEGPLRARLERQAARLPIDFTGFVSDRHTVARLLASADVTLAPGPHETFGLAALEVAGVRNTGRGVAHVGIERDHHAGQRCFGRQRPGRHCESGQRHRQSTRTPPPQICETPRRGLHLAPGGNRHAGIVGGAGTGRPARRFRTHRIAPPGPGQHAGRPWRRFTCAAEVTSVGCPLW